ncbi:MAG: hypothetical protein R3C03_05460 [Pirellulaceae bacterium]
MNTDGPGGGAAGSWQDLAGGIPTIAGLAALAGRAVSGVIREPVELGTEAKVLLATAKERGVFEIKGSPDAFDSDGTLVGHLRGNVRR